MNNWISTAERTPERGTEVLVWIDETSDCEGGVGVDVYDAAHDAEDPPEWCVYGDLVTHWQPLPGRPE